MATNIVCRAVDCIFNEKRICISEEIVYDPDEGCLTYEILDDLVDEDDEADDDALLEDDDLEWDDEDDDDDDLFLDEDLDDDDEEDLELDEDDGNWNY